MSQQGQNRQDRFVGRKYQQKQYNEFLKGKKNYWILYFIGMPGIGKTRLLCQLKEQTPPDVGIVHIDFEYTGPYPDSGKEKNNEEARELSSQASHDESDHSRENRLLTDPLQVLQFLASSAYNLCDHDRYEEFVKIKQRERNQIKQADKIIEELIEEINKTSESQELEQLKNLSIEQEIEQNRSISRVIDAFCAQLATLKRRKLVFMLDTCEKLKESEGWVVGQWLIDELLPRLHECMGRKCLVVIASRVLLDSVVLQKQDQKHIDLPMLKQKEVNEYLEKAIIDNSRLIWKRMMQKFASFLCRSSLMRMIIPKRATANNSMRWQERIYQMTRGHPLSLDIIRRLWNEEDRRTSSDDDENITEFQLEYDERVSTEFVEGRILKRLDDHLKELTEYGVLLRSFSLPQLKDIGLLPAEPEADYLFNQFMDYPYIEPKGGYRYAFHEFVRETLAKYTQERHPQEWRDYHQKAKDFLFAPGEPEWHYHTIALNEAEGMKALGEAVQQARTSGNSRGIGSLLQAARDEALNLTLTSQLNLTEKEEQFYRDIEAVRKVEERLSHAKKLSEEIEHLRERAKKLEAEGDEHWQYGKLGLALESYNQALLLFQRIGNHSVDEARLLSQIDTLRLEIKPLREKAIGLVAKGDDQRQRGELDPASESYGEALQLFQQISNHSVDGVTYKIWQVHEALFAITKDQERLIEDNVQPEEEALTNGPPPHVPLSLLKRRPLLVACISLLIVILLVIVTFTPILQMISPHPISLQLPPGIGITQSSNSESIGISNGTFTFNCQTDNTLKCQAADQLRQGDIDNAKSLWNREVAVNTNDAEALIYLEDQRVQNSPHITLVVATTLTGPTADLGQDNLQGAYVAQKEFNDGFKLPNGLKVSLLIANFGSNPKDAATIAKQIVKAAQADTTIVGVMGLPLSDSVSDAIPILQQARLPLVSPTASSDALTGISPSFFRTVPPNDFQARVGADYAIHTLHAHTATLFYDLSDSSSENLAKDFKRYFTDLGGSTGEKTYTTGDSEALHSQLKDILQNPPDLLYFAGSATDMNTILMNLPSSSNLQIMGGNSLNQPQAYSAAPRLGLTQLHFTAFASPDEWKLLCSNGLSQACVNPSFFTVYPQAFDDSKHQQQPYGYSRANSDTILSYDALSVLLIGCQRALPQGQTTPLTSQQAQTGLKMITSTQPFQGVSGQISFGADGNPLNKAIVVLSLGSNGDVELASTNGIQGCFVVVGCTNP